MKKVLLAAFAGLSIIGASMAGSNNTGARYAYRQILTDTIPRDTTKPKPSPDTTSPKIAYTRQALRDTIPRDTTNPKPSPDTTKLAFVR